MAIMKQKDNLTSNIKFHGLTILYIKYKTFIKRNAISVFLLNKQNKQKNKKSYQITKGYRVNL